MSLSDLYKHLIHPNLILSESVYHYLYSVLGTLFCSEKNLFIQLWKK